MIALLEHHKRFTIKYVGNKKEPYRYYEKDHPYLSTLSVKKRVDYRKKQTVALLIVLVFLFFIVETIILWGASSSKVAYSPLKSNVFSGVKPPKPKLLVKADPDKPPPPPVLQEAEMYLVIPKLFVNSPIEPKATSQNGEVLLPSKNTSIGWYKDGVKPGQNGSVFLTAYYASENSGVLKDASKIAAGDELQIRFKSGKSVQYKVTEISKYKAGEEINSEILKKEDAKYLSLFLIQNVQNSKVGLDSDRLVVYAKSE